MNESTLITQVTLHIKESGFRNLGTFCLFDMESGIILLVESRILGFGIWNTALGIRNPTKDWNP